MHSAEHFESPNALTFQTFIRAGSEMDTTMNPGASLQVNEDGSVLGSLGPRRPYVDMTPAEAAETLQGLFRWREAHGNGTCEYLHRHGVSVDPSRPLRDQPQVLAFLKTMHDEKAESTLARWETDAQAENAQLDKLREALTALAAKMR
jgi:hypothetical protein